MPADVEGRGGEPAQLSKPIRRSGRGLSKTIINFCLNLTLLVLFVALAWITLIVRFVFPSVPDASGWTLWGHDVVDWRDTQFNVLCLFGAAVILHVMLHWSWVTGVINQRIFKRQAIPANGVDTLIGVGLLALILHLLGAGLLIARYCAVHQ